MEGRAERLARSHHRESDHGPRRRTEIRHQQIHRPQSDISDGCPSSTGRCISGQRGDFGSQQGPAAHPGGIATEKSTGAAETRINWFKLLYRRNQYGKLLLGPESSGPAQHSPAPSGPHTPELRSAAGHIRWMSRPGCCARGPTLHYIRCALSYQNQLLADIKALLEQLAERES